MARKLPRLERALDAPALASVAYGEVASSIYFALGIIALHALGFTPAILGIVGALFLIVALSYAEGTASMRETGGAATFVRVAFNDLAGLPHRLGALPRLPDRDRAVGAVLPALPRARARHRLDRAPSGRRDRRRRADRADRGGEAHAAHAALHLRDRGAAARSRHAAPARRARLRAALLRQRAHARAVARRDAVVAPARVRAAAGDARVHRARDGRQSRRGGEAARAATCRAACSAGSAPSSSSTS